MCSFIQRNAVILIMVLLAAITVAVYAPVAKHDFINLDDNGYVTDNKVVQAGMTSQDVVWAFTTNTESNWHPLTWLSHMLDCQLYGVRNPGGHHVTALIFHVLNSLLLFFILRRMTGFVWRSAFVAALFAVHPVHVESVAWVAERKDVLSTFFWLLTMLAYVRYAERPGVARYLPVIVLFALGLMAKPMLVTLPFVLLLLDYWPLGRFSRPTPVRSLVLEKVPLFALSAASSVITYLAQRDTAVASLERYPFGVRLANAVVAYATYLGKMVWPRNLSVFYPHPGASLPAWQVVGSVLILICISALVFYAGRRRPYLTVGWLWYLWTLVPVIGLVQVGNQAMADRYTYVPLIGMFAAIAWLVAECFTPCAPEAKEIPRPAKRKPEVARPSQVAWEPTVVALAVIAALIPITCAQVGYWQDTGTLFRHVVSIFPKDAAAHVLIANEMEKNGLPDAAIGSYTRAVELNPSLTDAQFNLAILLDKSGRVDEAVRRYTELVRMKPDHARAQCNLGNDLLRMGRFEEAIRHLRAAVKADPQYPQAHYNLGVALQERGQNEESVESYANAIRLKPDYSAAHENLAILLYGQGKYLDAWKEVNLSRKSGGRPHSGFLAALSQQMPDPGF